MTPPLPPHYRPAPVVLADKWTIVAGEWVQVPHFLAKQPDGWTEVPVRVGDRTDKGDDEMNTDYAVHNPNNRPIEDLPVIYGFNNGGSPGWYYGVLITEDGTVLGGHICSDEWFMPGDLGILAESRPDRHETFRKHYPDGYRMVFVPSKDVMSHAGLDAACKRNLAAAAKSNPPSLLATEGTEE